MHSYSNPVDIRTSERHGVVRGHAPGRPIHPEFIAARFDWERAAIMGKGGAGGHRYGVPSSGSELDAEVVAVGRGEQVIRAR
jgi:hypothetical protein